MVSICITITTIFSCRQQCHWFGNSSAMQCQHEFVKLDLASIFVYLFAEPAHRGTESVKVSNILLMHFLSVQTFDPVLSHKWLNHIVTTFSCHSQCNMCNILTFFVMFIWLDPQCEQCLYYCGNKAQVLGCHAVINYCNIIRVDIVVSKKKFIQVTGRQ